MRDAATIRRNSTNPGGCWRHRIHGLTRWTRCGAGEGNQTRRCEILCNVVRRAQRVLARRLGNAQLPGDSHDGPGYCYTFFEIGVGDTLAFFEQMSLVHPKHFNARSASLRHVAFEVEGDATMQRFKRKLDAAGIANTLENLGTSLSLRFSDPNGLILEFTTTVG
jgi:hypothetical protein